MFLSRKLAYMHEMGLATKVVDIVVETAAEAHAKKVKTIYMTIGEYRDVIENMFEGLVRHLARGTVAEEADVVIFRTPLMGKCVACGTPYPVKLDKEDSCPLCGERTCTLYSGTEFEISRLDVE